LPGVNALAWRWSDRLLLMINLASRSRVGGTGNRVRLEGIGILLASSSLAMVLLLSYKSWLASAFGSCQMECMMLEPWGTPGFMYIQPADLYMSGWLHYCAYHIWWNDWISSVYNTSPTTSVPLYAYVFFCRLGILASSLKLWKLYVPLRFWCLDTCTGLSTDCYKPEF
jgi:hypothetical protein